MNSEPFLPSMELEVCIWILQLAVIIPIWVFLSRLSPFDKFSRSLIIAWLLPDTIALIAKIVMTITDSYSIQTTGFLYGLRQVSSHVVLSSFLVQVIGYRHYALNKKENKILKERSIAGALLLVDIGGIFALCYLMSNTTLTILNIHSHVIELLLIIATSILMFMTHRLRGQYVERRKFPSGKRIFQQLFSLLRCIIIVQLVTVDYAIFYNPSSIGILPECIAHPQKCATSTMLEYPPFMYFVQNCRPMLLQLGLWLWQPGFRFAIYKAVAKSAHQLQKNNPNTITVSTEPFPSRSEPPARVPDAETGPRADALSIRGVSGRFDHPDIPKGPFARIQRQQSRLGTGYMRSLPIRF